MKQQIKDWQSKFPRAAWISKGSRGVMTGGLSTAIRKTAKLIGLSIDVRHARLKLASEVFGREVATFNELSDAELWALSQWVLQQNADGLANWLRQQFGATGELKGCE